LQRHWGLSARRGTQDLNGGEEIGQTEVIEGLCDGSRLFKSAVERVEETEWEWRTFVRAGYEEKCSTDSSTWWEYWQEEGVGEAYMSDSEPGEKNFSIARRLVWSKPGNWSLFNRSEFIGGQGVPEFMPGVVNEEAVEWFEVIARYRERVGNWRRLEGQFSGVIYSVMFG